MKDKLGNQITIKEFFSRWKQGIQQITQLQLTKINLIAYVSIFIGIIIGLIVMLKSKTYWLFIVLCGSFILTLTAFISTIQKFIILKNIQKQKKGGTNEKESTV